MTVKEWRLGRLVNERFVGLAVSRFYELRILAILLGPLSIHVELRGRRRARAPLGGWDCQDCSGHPEDHDRHHPDCKWAGDRP